MSFTDARVDLRYDDTWNDITDEPVYNRNPVTITRGRRSEGGTADPGQVELTVNNRGGRFSPRNPTSDLFGKIGRNTPVRVRVPSTETGIEFRNAQSGDPSDVDGWMQRVGSAITGDIDIRIDMTRQSWETPFAEVLASKWVESGDDRSWMVTLQGPSFLAFWWTENGVDILLSTSATLPALAGRNSIRVTMDVDNGSSQRVIRFEYGPTLDGPWTLVHTSTQAGTTSIHGGGTANLAIGSTASTNGSAIFAGTNALRAIVHGFRLYDGIDGTLVADPELAGVEPESTPSHVIPDAVTGNWVRLTPSWPSFRTPPAIPDPYRPDVRIAAEVVRWPQRWDTSGRDVYVPITASGIMRRLGSPGRGASDSVHRHVLLPRVQDTTDLLGYWTLSDPEGATRAATATMGGQPMQLLRHSARPQFGKGELGHWLPACMLTGETGGSMKGSAQGATGGWTLDLMYRAPDPASWGTAEPQRFAATVEDTQDLEWRVAVGSSTDTLEISVTQLSNGTTVDSASTGLGHLLDGKPHHIRLSAQEASGTNTSMFVWVDGVLLLSDTVNIGVTTTPAPARVGIRWATTGSFTLPVNVGQVILWGAVPVALDVMTDVYFGWRGEDAVSRVARICYEEQIVHVIRCGRSEAPRSSRLGPQGIVTPLQLVQEAAHVDGGILAETRDRLGLDFRPLFTLVDRPATLTLDYSAAHVMPPFHPDEDDQGLVNEVTARQVGSDEQAHVELATGALSVQDPPAGVGRYPANPNLNVDQASQLLGVAGWLMHLGTWDEARYPSLVVDLRRAVEILDLPEMREQALALDSGHRADVTDLPDHQPPGDARLLVNGYTETVSAEQHRITCNASPFGPYLLGELGVARHGVRYGDTFRHAAPGPISDSQTTVTFEVTTKWVNSTDNPELFPFNIQMHQNNLPSEIMQVTAANAPAGDIQEFTVVRGINMDPVAHPVGTVVMLVDPLRYTLEG